MRFLAALLMASLGLGSQALAQFHVTVDPGESDRRQTPMMVMMTEFKPQITRVLVTLKSAEGEVLHGQADQILDAEGKVLGARVEWIQPELKAGHPKTYAMTMQVQAYDGTKVFHYIDGEGYRDLFYGDQGVYRYVNKYDPANAANTSKPFHHVYGMHGEGFITKGPPGGSDPHHRGLFFGFITPLGNFWSCSDAHQEHEGYDFGVESTGPVAARSVSMIDWVGKNNQTAIRERRDVTAYHVANDELVLDFDLTIQSVAGDIKLGGDPHHAGFHFRAAQEVADRKPGGAKYILPASAKMKEKDEWTDCPWAECHFTIKGHPYRVIHMDDPSNPKPTIYSTRAYGRFGASYNGVLKQDSPLHFKYRVVVLDEADHPEMSQEELAERYADFSNPPVVTITK